MQSIERNHEDRTSKLALLLANIAFFSTLALVGTLILVSVYYVGVGDTFLLENGFIH